MPIQPNRNSGSSTPGRKPAPSWQKGYEESQKKVNAELATGMLTIRTMAKRLGVTTATIKSVAKKIGINHDDWATAEFSELDYKDIKRIIIAQNNSKATVVRFK